jgi:hypothetical protein
MNWRSSAMTSEAAAARGECTGTGDWSPATSVPALRLRSLRCIQGDSPRGESGDRVASPRELCTRALGDFRQSVRESRRIRLVATRANKPTGEVADRRGVAATAQA